MSIDFSSNICFTWTPENLPGIPLGEQDLQFPSSGDALDEKTDYKYGLGIYQLSCRKGSYDTQTSFDSDTTLYSHSPFYQSSYVSIDELELRLDECKSRWSWNTTTSKQSHETSMLKHDPITPLHKAKQTLGFRVKQVLQKLRRPKHVALSTASSNTLVDRQESVSGAVILATLFSRPLGIMLTE